jgi:hypothetical protein
VAKRKPRPRQPKLTPHALEWVEQKLEKMRKAFEAGKKSALLAALRLSCQCGPFVKTPEWVYNGVRDAIYRYEGAEVRTLDEAFGVKRPKNWRQRAELTRKRLGLEVVARIHVWKSVGESVTKELYAEVGRDLGISQSQVQELWEAGKDSDEWLMIAASAKEVRDN